MTSDFCVLIHPDGRPLCCGPRAQCEGAKAWRVKAALMKVEKLLGDYDRVHANFHRYKKEGDRALANLCFDTLGELRRRIDTAKKELRSLGRTRIQRRDKVAA